MPVEQTSSLNQNWILVLRHNGTIYDWGDKPSEAKLYINGCRSNLTAILASAASELMHLIALLVGLQGT
ncbi:MAG: hypothetical protein NVSMB70_01550 [Chamaesiphon sp.]